MYTQTGKQIWLLLSADDDLTGEKRLLSEHLDYSIDLTQSNQFLEQRFDWPYKHSASTFLIKQHSTCPALDLDVTSCYTGQLIKPY